MLSKISDKAILNLSKFFGKQAEENSSIHFAILGTEDMIKGQEFEPWYKIIVFGLHSSGKQRSNHLRHRQKKASARPHNDLAKNQDL